ncbi:MAG: ATP-binding protein [Pseudomonadota bacterium]
MAGSAGHVITFEDITQQLLDQRRAAWSDVARRIAHEIKNPLTPIQLAAERLQRRFGKNITDGNAVFTQLTGTIVRQVGDLRNIVDEFSSFARMPKPTFRQENLVDILKQALFLQDVSNPDITFEFKADEGDIPLVCDRRQLGQAFTNVIKNAVEAIGQKLEQTAPNGEQPNGQVCLTVSFEDDHITIQLDDNGIGLPADRERIVEPYMTTREKGTGLGLAIVKKIIEEHFGEIAFDDAPDGGTRVTIIFNSAKLERLGQNPTLDGDIVGQEVGAGSDLAQNIEDQRK